LIAIVALDIGWEIRAVETFAGRASVDRHGAIRGDRLHRMCQGALNLLTYVLPGVPLRQWVLTLPYELRPLAHERNLMGAVVRIFADSVMRRARRSSILSLFELDA
jgi:hypothetical protein